MIKSPGLVAEGRDMTSTVYSDARIKIYLDASQEERAKRRLNDELKEDSGKHKTFEEVLAEVKDRDMKDKNRHHGPLVITPDAYYLDTTGLDIDTVTKLAIAYCDSKLNENN